MKTAALTPSRLRLFLSISLFLVTGAGIGLFYVANSQLQTIAEGVSKTTMDANASRNNIQTLQAIQDELKKQQDAIKRADNIAASSQSYNYQNQIISDLNVYASRADVTITNIDFAAPTAGGSTSATPSSGMTVPDPATATPDGAPAVVPGGLQTATISVTLKSPVEYTKLLNFFNMLEQSVPKLQISKVNLTKSDLGGGVSSDVLSIEVYIR
jgi:hypothetical protein